MSVEWTAERFVRYYGEDWATNLLHYHSPRFAKQADRLIAAHGLTPATGLVIAADAFGGLGTAFVERGWDRANIELTDSAQVIQDLWDTHGSPYVNRPHWTNSYDEADRIAVRSQARNSSLADIWCLVGDCAGDDADVSRFAGWNDPQTGYVKGNGKVVHLITPQPTWAGADPQPDNVWQSAADWQAAFDPLGQIVMSLHDTAPGGSAIRRQKVRATNVPKTPFSAAFPFDVPVLRSNLGPFVTNRVYLATTYETGPRVTAWDKASGAYAEVGDAKPDAGGPVMSLTCQQLTGNRIGFAYVATPGGTPTVYVSIYDMDSNKWGQTDLVITNDVEGDQSAYVVQDSAGTLWLICNIVAERVMGVTYNRLGLFRWSGSSWDLTAQPNLGLQRSDILPAMIVGIADQLHWTVSDLAGNGQYVWTYANESLVNSVFLDTRGDAIPWAVKRGGKIHFVYQNLAGSIRDLSFTSADDPNDYDTTPIGASPVGSPYAACLHGETIYAAWSEVSTPAEVYLANDGGGVWQTEVFDDDGSGLATINRRTDGIGVLYLDAAQGPDRFYAEADLAPKQAQPHPYEAYRANYDAQDGTEPFMRATMMPTMERRAEILDARLPPDVEILFMGDEGYLADAYALLRPTSPKIINTNIEPWVLQTMGNVAGYETNHLPIDNSSRTWADRVDLVDNYRGGVPPEYVVICDFAVLGRISSDALFSLLDWPYTVDQTAEGYTGSYPSVKGILITSCLRNDPRDDDDRAQNPTWLWLYLDHLHAPAQYASETWMELLKSWNADPETVEVWCADWDLTMGVWPS